MHKNVHHTLKNSLNSKEFTSNRTFCVFYSTYGYIHENLIIMQLLYVAYLLKLNNVFIINSINCRKFSNLVQLLEFEL